MTPRAKREKDLFLIWPWWLGGLAFNSPAIALLAIVCLALGCGGSAPKTKPVVVEKPVEAPLDPPCPSAKSFTLADGKLRCRELPFTIDFPANSALEREDSDNLSFIRATLDRGVLAVFLEPRFEVMAGDDATGLRKRLDALVMGIAGDATILEAKAPPQEGATVSTAISFTTPDGGAGLVHAYLAHGWFIAVIAGGRKTDTPARPDQPAGKAFLASLKIRPLSTTWAARDVAEGVRLELPASAWEQLTGDPETKLWAAVTERSWIGARPLDASPQCALFNGVTDADVPALVKKMFGKDDLNVTGKIVTLGTKAMYAELETAGGTLTMYLVCKDPRVTMVTVVGKRPVAELRVLLDRVASTLK